MKVISCAFRGRSNGEWYMSEHHQKLEIGTDVSNSITGVSKDFYVIEIYEREEII